MAIRSITLAVDGSLVAAANNLGECFVWRMGSRSYASKFQPLTKIDAHQTYILKCLFSRDVKFLATMSADHTIKLWEVDKMFALAKVLIGHERWVWDGLFSADSAYLVTASSDTTVRLWSVEKGETIRQYTGHHKAVVCVTHNDKEEQAADSI